MHGNMFIQYNKIHIPLGTTAAAAAAAAFCVYVCLCV